MKAQQSWRENPQILSEQFFSSRLWSKQLEVLNAVKQYPRVAIKSGNTVGKSRISAEIALWFLLAHYPSKVIITAPTWLQVEQILFKEIAHLYNHSIIPLGSPNDLLKTELKFNEEWFALGVSTDEVNRFQGFHCFSEDTEILTQRGWLGIDEIDLNDNCLSVKVNTNKAEWKPIKNIHKFPFEGYLNCYKDRVLNFAVTDEHRFPTKYDSSSKKWELKKFCDLKKKFVIQRKLSWQGNNIKVPKEFGNMTSSEFAEFIGFWTGDGGVRQHYKTKRFYEILFYQKKKSGCEYLENHLLKKIKYSKKQDYYSISNIKICQWLINNIGRYGIDRQIPPLILNTTSEIIMAYLTGLWKAEGSLRENGQWGQLYNTSKKLMDGVQELLLKLGKPTTLGINCLKGSTPLAKNTCYVLSFTTSSADSVILKNKVKREYYQGRVWCISTEYETFVARRNGQMFVSGNSPYLLIILDEALGIKSEIWEAIEGLHPYRILAIGNPLSPEGEFYKCFQSPLWHKITINCQECVNWQNQNGAIAGLVTQQWIEERKIEWGVKSPLYQSRVLGEFPQEGTDTLIHLNWLDKAREIEIEEDSDLDEAIKIVACDVARYGADKSVFLDRRGHTIYKIEIKEKIPTTMTTGIVKRHYEQEKADCLVVDDSGLGGGVSDMLSEQKIGVLAFNGGAKQKAIDKNHFKNLRSQFYYITAKKFEKRMYSLKQLPQREFDMLKSQLCNIKYWIESDGKIAIETKDDMKARGLNSPDLADALMMSEFGFYIGKMGDIKAYAYR